MITEAIFKSKLEKELEDTLINCMSEYNDKIYFNVLVDISLSVLENMSKVLNVSKNN